MKINDQKSYNESILKDKETQSKFRRFCITLSPGDLVMQSHDATFDYVSVHCNLGSSFADIHCFWSTSLQDIAYNITPSFFIPWEYCRILKTPNSVFIFSIYYKNRLFKAQTLYKIIIWQKTHVKNNTKKYL